MEQLKSSELNARLIAEFARRNGAPWVRKFGSLCIQEVLVATKSLVRTYVRLPFMLAYVKCHTF